MASLGHNELISWALHVSAIWHIWWRVNISSCDGLLPEGTKPLHEPKLTQNYFALWLPLGHNEVNKDILVSNAFTADDNDKKRKRLDGGGRKPKVPEIRIAMFQWFIDVRTALKGRISLKFFQWTSKQLHQAHLEYKEQQGENITQE